LVAIVLALSAWLYTGTDGRIAGAQADAGVAAGGRADRCAACPRPHEGLAVGAMTGQGVARVAERRYRLRDTRSVPVAPALAAAVFQEAGGGWAMVRQPILPPPTPPDTFQVPLRI
jgi:hypothetical protein